MARAVPVTGALAAAAEVAAGATAAVAATLHAGTEDHHVTRPATAAHVPAPKHPHHSLLAGHNHTPYVTFYWTECCTSLLFRLVLSLHFPQFGFSSLVCHNIQKK